MLRKIWARTRGLQAVADRARLKVDAFEHAEGALDTIATMRSRSREGRASISFVTPSRRNAGEKPSIFCRLVRHPPLAFTGTSG
jgi:hypothetical protein